MMAVQAYCIRREDTPAYLEQPRILGWLDAAYAATGLDMPDDLEERLRQGHMQLWVAYSPGEGQILCAVLTQLAKMRGNLHAQVVAAGGSDVQRWVSCIPTIEEWAKREGCSKVTVQGRPGWAKLLRRYRRSQVVLELAL